MKIIFDQKFIDQLDEKAEQYDINDTAQKGLFLRIFPNGTKSYYFRSNNKVMYLGNTKTTTLASIRETIVRQYNIEVQSDVSISVKQFYHTGMREALLTLKPTTQKEMNQNIREYILPIFGNRSLSSITTSEVQNFHESMNKTKYKADRVLMALSLLFKEAYNQKAIYTANPCKAVKRFHTF